MRFITDRCVVVSRDEVSFGSSFGKLKAAVVGSTALIAILGANAPRAQEVTLPTIDVQGASSAPLQQVPQIGKTGTRVEDLPASVKVVPAEQVREQGGTDLKAAITDVSGVNEGGGSSYGFFDRFQIRGLDARIYEDGFSDGDQINGVPHSLNGVQSIEVLKGPGSALFGSGPPGGSINIVHFLPSTAPAYGAGTQIGSFGSILNNAYAAGPTSVPGFNYRIDGTFQHADGFRSLESKDVELRPVFEWNHGDHDTTIAFDLRHIEETPDPQGIIYVRPSPGAIGYPLGVVPSDTKYSSPYNHGNQDFARAMFTDRWIVSDVLTVNNRFSYLHRDLDILRNGDSGTVTGTIFSGRTMRHQHDLDDDITYQLEPVWKFSTGPIGHTLLTGIEAREQWIVTHRETAALPNITNIFAPVVPDQSPPAAAAFMPNFADDLRATYLGIYATDQMDLTEKWKLRLGIRQDYWNTNLTPRILGQTDGATALIPGVTYSRTDMPVSWNAGTLYHVLPGISPYVGVSSGHLANFNSEAAANGVHAPEDSMQYEAGVKFEAFNQRVALTTALFDTERHNVQAFLPPANVVVVFNSQRTKGFEADLELHPIDQWKIYANVTLQTAELTDNPSAPSAVGNLPPGVPKHMFNAWTTYDFRIGNLDGFKIGAGVRARDQVYADAANNFAVPAWAILDAFIGYYQLKWDIAFGIKNIADTTYFVTANGSGGFVGDPRTFYLKANYRWD